MSSLRSHSLVVAALMTSALACYAPPESELYGPPSSRGATPTAPDGGTSTGGNAAAPTGSTGGGTSGGASNGTGTPTPSPATGNDAGSSPSGPSGGDAGGGGAGCGNSPVCDDFEADSAGAAPSSARWTVVQPNCSGTGVVAVDATQAHSGSKSVKVTGAGGYCNHVFFASTAPSSIGKVLFGRFYVRMESALGDGHTTLAAFKDSVENKDLRMGGQSGILMWNRESDDATLPELSPTGISKSVRPAAQTWQCVEFQLDGNAATLRTWVDGRDVTGLVVDGTATPDVDSQWLRKTGWSPAVVDAKFGWESYAGQANTLWFDDIALGPQRIGCGP